MYSIVRTKGFEKSYKKTKESGKLKQQAKESLVEVITLLAEGKKLPVIYRDHQLCGELREYRECHIKGDLLLVYTIHKKESLLVLVDMGSHSYLDLS